ncbi:MAG: hypothetical protein Q9209_004799 [Squamulea sp. 1 TL-2023]
MSANTKTSAELDKTGTQECLRFPPFHQEMLTQDWWNPGEDVGRIKLVISEGLVSGQEPPAGFRRVRNIMTFAFQHAPLAILEDAGIAWPNAGMWYHATQPLYTPPSPCRIGATDVDAHAHSPRRRNVPSGYSTNAAGAFVAPRMLMNLSMPPPARRNVQMNDHSWASHPQMQDPFLEQHRHQAPRQWGMRLSTSDDSMPDYSQSITPRSSRDASLQEMQGIHGGPLLQHNSQFEELMAALSPTKIDGTHAPPTTRVSSASNSPPVAYRNFGGANLATGTYQGQPRSVSMTTHEALPRSVREVSDISMKSRFLDKSCASEHQASEGEHGHSKVRRSPATEVKGRKEGRSSERNVPSRQTGTVKRRTKSTTNNSEEVPILTGEMKRKREGVTSVPELLSEQSEGAGSSPSRKITRTVSKDSLGGASARTALADDTTRTPLSSLENIQ